ncbi:hypothetical protein L873DRAFT_1934862, partial [Choiromyces venosus 120613-1]
YHAHPVTALAVTLYQLSYPSRLKQSISIFEHKYGWLSTVFNDVCNHLYYHYADKLYWDGFINGTQRPICQLGRETADQTLFYTGHRKQYTMQFQVIATPDGLIASLSGPREGRIGDWGMWVNSGLGKILKIYGRNLFSE